MSDQDSSDMLQPSPDNGAVGQYVNAIESWILNVHGNYLLPEGDLDEAPFQDEDSKMSQRSGMRKKSRIWDQVSDYTFPTKVPVGNELKDALNGLDRCLIEASIRERNVHDDFAVEIKNVVETVATIPSFLKTVFLIEDDDDKKSVLDHLIMKRVLLCRYSVMDRQAAFDILDAEALAHRSRALSRAIPGEGEVEGPRLSESWLLEIFKTEKRQLTNLALDYLEMISNMTVEDYVLPVPLSTSSGTSQATATITSSTPLEKPSPTERDMEKFKSERKKLFKTVSELDLLLTYINTLPNRDIERIAVSDVVNRAIEDATFSPFSVFIMFFDLVFHLVLLGVMRRQIFSEISPSVEDSQQDESPSSRLIDTVISDGLLLAEIASLAYLAFRIIGDIIATARTSLAAFLTLIFSFWGIVDIVAIVMASFILKTHLSADRENNRTAGYFYLSAFTIGMLWLKLVGVSKVANWKLATFVMAVDQIVLDIRLFVLILVLIIVCFGDMFFAIMSAACLLETPFCDNRFKSYLAIYRAMVGDLDFGEYSLSPVTAGLFALMTFTIVILLLNLLIALVDESYERSTMRSARLFGLARINFLSKVAALEAILDLRGRGSPSKTMKQKKGTTAIIQHYLLVVMDALLQSFMIILSVIVQGVISMIAYVIVIDEWENSGKWLETSLIIAIILWYLQLVQLSLLITGWRYTKRKRGCLYYFQVNPFTKYFVAAPIYLFVRFILGRNIFGKTKTSNNSDDDDDDDDGQTQVQWQGRMTFIDRQVQTEMSTSVVNLKRNVTLVENRLETVESSVKSEIGSVYQQMDDKLDRLEERYKNEMKTEVAAWEDRLVESLVKAVTASA